MNSGLNKNGASFCRGGQVPVHRHRSMANVRGDFGTEPVPWPLLAFLSNLNHLCIAHRVFAISLLVKPLSHCRIPVLLKVVVQLAHVKFS